MLAHGGEGEHAAIVGIDTPALPGDIAAPDETDIAPIRRRGAEAADHRLADDVGMRQIAKFDAIEDILARGEIFQQHLGGEVALGESGDRRQNPRIAKRFSRGDLDQHLRRPVHARPHHAAIGADIAGLHTMGDDRAVGGTAEIGHGDGAEARHRRGRKKMASRKSAGNPARVLDRHASLLDRPTKCAGDADRRRKIM